MSHVSCRMSHVACRMWRYVPRPRLRKTQIFRGWSFILKRTRCRDVRGVVREEEEEEVFLETSLGQRTRVYVWVILPRLRVYDIIYIYILTYIYMRDVWHSYVKRLIRHVYCIYETFMCADTNMWEIYAKTEILNLLSSADMSVCRWYMSLSKYVCLSADVICLLQKFPSLSIDKAYVCHVSVCVSCVSCVSVCLCVCVSVCLSI